MIKNGFQLMLSTFIKLPVVIKTFILSIFEWPFDTGFSVGLLYNIYRQNPKQ